MVGRGFQLIATDPAVIEALDETSRQFLQAIGATVAVVADEGSGAQVIDVDGTYAKWFADHGRAAVLARPDFYLYGSAADAGDVNELVSALRTSIGATAAASASEAAPA